MSNINKKYAILSSIIVILAVILVLTILLKNRGYSLPTLKAINSNISEIKKRNKRNFIDKIKRRKMDFKRRIYSRFGYYRKYDKRS